MRNDIFGWDLPPGCRVSDIPGNRPEDEAWENIYEGFWDKERLTNTHIGLRITEEEYERMDELYNQATPNISDVIDDYISAAIEYGIEIGQSQSDAVARENKSYAARYNEEIRNPKLWKFFKALRAGGTR